MKITKVSTKCSFDTTFEEFGEKMLIPDSSGLTPFFTEDFTSFGLVNHTGLLVENFDILFDSEDERLAFIQFLKNYDEGHWLGGD